MTKDLTMLNERFGEKVARIVVACSDSTGGEKGDWRPRKERYLAHLVKELVQHAGPAPARTRAE